LPRSTTCPGTGCFARIAAELDQTTLGRRANAIPAEGSEGCTERVADRETEDRSRGASTDVLAHGGEDRRLMVGGAALFFGVGMLLRGAMRMAIWALAAVIFVVGGGLALFRNVF